VPKLLYFSERLGCGATMRLDSSEIVIVSLASSGLLVRLNRGILGLFFGPVVYREKALQKVARIGIMLALEYPAKSSLLPQFKSPVLASYANAVWHCSTAAEVVVAISTAAQRAEREDIIEAAGTLVAFEDAKNWKPSGPEPLTCRAVFSDGKTQETRLMPYEVATWPVESNSLFEREARPYRIIRILNEVGSTLWAAERFTQAQPNIQKPNPKHSVIDSASRTVSLFKTAPAWELVAYQSEVFVPEYISDSRHPSAPVDLRTKGDALSSYLGIQSNGVVTQAAVYKFERRFNQFLLENTAPNKDVAFAFCDFRNELVTMYRSLASAGIEISADIQDWYVRALTVNAANGIVLMPDPT
jgi:hypothetical protein